MLLAAGKAQISSGDDALNAASDTQPAWLAVSGGEWTLNAEGDGFDSNGAGAIRGGAVTVFGPRNGGNGAIDVQDGLVMAGGVLWASGAQGMDEAPVTSSAQAAVKFTGMQVAAGSKVQVLNSEGSEVFALTLEKEASSVVFSSSDVIAGQEYVLSVDGAQVATAAAGEYAQSAGLGGEPGAGGGPAGNGGQGAPAGMGGRVARQVVALRAGESQVSRPLVAQVVLVARVVPVAAPLASNKVRVALPCRCTAVWISACARDTPMGDTPSEEKFVRTWRDPHRRISSTAVDKPGDFVHKCG